MKNKFSLIAIVVVLIIFFYSNLWITLALESATPTTHASSTNPSSSSISVYESSENKATINKYETKDISKYIGAPEGSSVTARGIELDKSSTGTKVTFEGGDNSFFEYKNKEGKLTQSVNGVREGLGEAKIGRGSLTLDNDGKISSGDLNFDLENKYHHEIILNGRKLDIPSASSISVSSQSLPSTPNDKSTRIKINSLMSEGPTSINNPELTTGKGSFRNTIVSYEANSKKEFNFPQNLQHQGGVYSFKEKDGALQGLVEKDATAVFNHVSVGTTSGGKLWARDSDTLITTGAIPQKGSFVAFGTKFNTLAIGGKDATINLESGNFLGIDRPISIYNVNSKNDNPIGVYIMGMENPNYRQLRTGMVITGYAEGEIGSGEKTLRFIKDDSNFYMGSIRSTGKGSSYPQSPIRSEYHESPFHITASLPPYDKPSLSYQIKFDANGGYSVFDATGSDPLHTESPEISIENNRVRHYQENIFSDDLPDYMKNYIHSGFHAFKKNEKILDDSSFKNVLKNN